MYKHKLLNTKTANATASRLQAVLLEYHELRVALKEHPLKARITELETWQSSRLKKTHADLHSQPSYKEGLNFLLEDLYSPKDFSQRDDDIDRIFPTMVKLLPETLLYTVTTLVELNLISQKLDLALTTTLFATMQVTDITEQSYAEAYQRCDNKSDRLHQIHLIANIGDDLDRYVHSRFLNFTLKMTKRPAEMAGVGALHDFLFRGFSAFKSMNRVDLLLDQIIQRETCLLEQIFEQKKSPLQLPKQFTQPWEKTGNGWQSPAAVTS